CSSALDLHLAMLCFLLTEPATPEIYTLSLHDALPIYRILGAALLGRDAGEVLSAVQMAMLGQLPYQQVRDAIFTHPTMAEGLNLDRKSTRLNSSHVKISYAVFCLKKKKKRNKLAYAKL